VDVAHEKLTLYSGNYSFYMKEKVLRNEIQRNAFANQQQKIKQTERFVERFRAKSTKARQVQSRIKSLERMDLIEEVNEEAAAINFRFNFKQKPGRFITHLESISKSFGDLQIFKDTDAIIERDDKIALIGANGKGKSTLLRIIAGTEPIKGKRKPGYNVNQAFYAQHQLEALHLNNEILDELKQSGSEKTEQELRSVLGCFLFSGDDVFKKIKVLSGGEKSRVALAKTLISESNFLILDEPTNHLDFISENILIQALQQYKGSFIIVSHNRYFISQVANKIWYIENQGIKAYPGTYEEYSYWKNRQLTLPTEVVKPEKKKQKKTKEPQSYDRLLKEEKTQLIKIEESIERLENEIREMEVSMSDPKVFDAADILQEINEKYKKSKKHLEQMNESWEQLVERITKLERK